jgi:cytochrome c oxidase cbb3-type subunit 3
MAGARDVDALTGTETTGHEWDGIKELNTPLPKWWLYVFYATIGFSIVYTILFPAWPSLSGYTAGVIGYSSRERHNLGLEQVRAQRAVWYEKFGVLPVDEIARNPDLLQFARAGGGALFADNCAPCHGTGGVGRPNYPVLVDDEWIWGGGLDDIRTTITHGVRSEDPDTRLSQMPAFGADGILTAEEISAVADHVLALSGAGAGDAGGAEIFAENCVACHGELGEGIAELGGPDLRDRIWLYGGSKPEIVSQIVRPKHGVMPAWSGRLDEVQIKQLTVYVHTILGGGR